MSEKNVVMAHIILKLELNSHTVNVSTEEGTYPIRVPKCETIEEAQNYIDKLAVNAVQKIIDVNRELIK